jgi:hexosaminidase
MNRIYYLIIFLLISSPFQAQTDLLIPYPHSIEIGEGQFRIKDGFSFKIIGSVKSERVNQALVNFGKRVAWYTTRRIDWLDMEDEGAGLTVSFNQTIQLSDHIDESYMLEVNHAGMNLTANTDIGILRGLETLIQSIGQDETGFFIPEMKIQDHARFAWRGLLVDVCRHFMPLDVLKRILDGMAHCKMNVFHWHLSEDQGFRVESKLFPKLHTLGSDGMYYTQDQVRDIVQYANLKGIRVVPEFDMPGHTTAWMVGHPELASAPGPYKIERYFGVFDPTMDPTKKSTYKFLEKWIKEMAELFPDAYFHIGGDENNGKQWDDNPSIQAFMKRNKLQDNHALQNFFNQKLHAILKKNGKQMMGWDEILQPGLDTSVVIHSWRGKEYMYLAAQKGYRSVLSNGYYIDLSYPAAHHYLNDPLPSDNPLSIEEQKRILGGEATMWSELVSPENIESRIWPRVAAIAERLWSPAHHRDTDNLYLRLQKLDKWLELSGSHHVRNRDYMIRRLSGEINPNILSSFLDWVEPLEGYKRHGSTPRYSSKTPLSRPVDAALLDAPASIKWRAMRAEFKQKEDWLVEYKKDLQIVLQLAPIWSREFSTSSALNQLLPLIEHLNDAAMIGMMMIESIEKNKQNMQQLAGWKQMLTSTKRATDELEIILPDLLLEMYVRSME